MAQNGDDWNTFIQSRPVRIAMNAFCTVICGSYAVGGVRELVSPDASSVVLREQLGMTGFYAMTAVRTLVCLWVAIVFCRATIKAIRED